MPGFFGTTSTPIYVDAQGNVMGQADASGGQVMLPPSAPPMSGGPSGLGSLGLGAGVVPIPNVPLPPLDLVPFGPVVQPGPGQMPVFTQATVPPGYAHRQAMPGMAAMSDHAHKLGQFQSLMQRLFGGGG